jgi:hypothetical protein
MSRRIKRNIPSSTEWLNSRLAKDLVRQALEAPTERRTQDVRILKLLIQAHGSDVPLPIIMRCAAQYNRCIHDLRTAGFRIVHRSEKRDGVLHSWYRLEIDVPEDLMPGPVQRPKREKRPEQNMQLFAAEQETGKPVQAAQEPTIWRDPEMGGARG